MRLRTKLQKWYTGLHPLSKLSLKLGAALMICFYIVGIISYLSAPYVANWNNAMSVFAGCLEAAPASLAAGVCAGLLGDILISVSGGKKDK